MIADKLKVRIREIERRIVRLFGGRSNRDVEYDFAFRNIIGRDLNILDIGGTESLISLALAKAGHKVTIYDYRPYQENHSNLKAIQGNFLKNRLPPKSYDIILLISTIEHMGFGGYGDPEYENADFEVMVELGRLLAHNGKLILTFPFNEKENIIPGYERWYTINRIKKLLTGWYVSDFEFWMPDKKLFAKWVKWLPSTSFDAGCAYKKKSVQGVACFTVTNQPVYWDISN